MKLHDNDGDKLAMVGAGVGDVPKGANGLTTTWVIGLMTSMRWLLAFVIVGTKATVNRVKASLPTHSKMDVQGDIKQDQTEGDIKQDQTQRWMKIGCRIDREKDKKNQGEIMPKNNKVPLSKNMAETYRNGVLHRVRVLSRFMSSQMDANLTRMYKAKKYVKHTASLRKIMKPNAVWDGVNKSFEMDNKDGVINREEVVIAVPWMRNPSMPVFARRLLEVRILFVTGMCMSVTLLDDGAPWIKFCCHNGTRVCLIVV
jgi:hypothetical protein